MAEAIVTVRSAGDRIDLKLAGFVREKGLAERQAGRNGEGHGDDVGSHGSGFFGLRDQSSWACGRWALRLVGWTGCEENVGAARWNENGRDGNA